MLYFDHNATHPLSRTAREAWLDAVERYVGNPSSPHRLGARADAALTQAREKVAGWLGCGADEIVWTSGATEANNAVLNHAAQAGAGEVWVSAIEHPCVLAAARRYFPKAHRLIPVTREGVVETEWLADELGKGGRPGLVAVMAANNETGVLQPWRDVLTLCRERDVPFLCDAAQWIGKLPSGGLGACDFISGCGHKFGGPQGVGFMKVPRKFQPLLVGGPQEDGRRAGTENVPGVLAMVAAIEEREVALAGGGVTNRLAMRQDFERRFLKEVVGGEIIGAIVERVWNTVSAVMPELPDCRQRWVVKLDRLGFAVSTGSACASGKEETSHVLAAMGCPGAVASRVLRFSSGWETGEAEWAELMRGIQRAAAL